MQEEERPDVCDIICVSMVPCYEYNFDYYIQDLCVQCVQCHPSTLYTLHVQTAFTATQENEWYVNRIIRVNPNVYKSTIGEWCIVPTWIYIVIAQLQVLEARQYVVLYANHCGDVSGTGFITDLD